MDLVNFDVYVNEDLTITIQTDKNRPKELLQVSFLLKNFLQNDVYLYRKNILYIFVF